MKKIVHSVIEYIEVIKEIRQRHESSDFLFRGQGNSEWKIESTLERSGLFEISFAKYYHDIDYLKPEINSLGHSFQRKIVSTGYDFDFTKWRDISFNHFPDLEFLAYLRHHGFPTPLIDVTQSEYVALFFACESFGLKNCQNKICNAKVFVLLDMFGSSSVSGHPELHKIGHYLETDKRHIAQQSEYLITAQYGMADKREWFFVPFESFMQQEQSIEEAVIENSGEQEQSYYEIEIDGNSKKDIMAELARMNINHYTLYLSEDALVQKLKHEFLRNVLK
ncbi:FRG domain-containing protein [Fibrobacter sp. UWH9]|uniref:FRG domain-containing protein n=1 Tax=Fibrobacter sp. UWH9 TaxID=1896213 RepID=UPI0009111A62|nr:FRG domain-containing protein [Fibrobacter sp. UWH9]SHH46562.1 FRG domain-containing protein [Fibrobacter sp. UWH9]